MVSSADKRLRNTSSDATGPSVRDSALIPLPKAISANYQHIISYHTHIRLRHSIVSHITSHPIISYHIISYHISHHITSHPITSPPLTHASNPQSTLPAPKDLSKQLRRFYILQVIECALTLNSIIEQRLLSRRWDRQSLSPQHMPQIVCVAHAL